MEPALEANDLFRLTVRAKGRGMDAFQILRNQDLSQVFYPATFEGSNGCPVVGPDDAEKGHFWYLDGREVGGERFTIEFQRTLQAESESLTLRWRLESA